MVLDWALLYHISFGDIECSLVVMVVVVVQLTSIVYDNHGHAQARENVPFHGQDALDTVRMESSFLFYYVCSRHSI